MTNARRTPRRGTRYPLSRFGQYLWLRKVKVGQLARDSGYSRQHIYHLSRGLKEPTRRCMVALTMSLRRLLRHDVQLSELWDVEDVPRLDVRQPGDDGGEG